MIQMDQQTNQGNNNQVPSPSPAIPPYNPHAAPIGSIAREYTLAYIHHPSHLPQERISRDLEILKKADLESDTDVKLTAKLTTPVMKSEDLPLKRVKEIDVLKLKNPFRGI